MTETEPSNQQSFLSSVRNAWKGLRMVVLEERNFRLQLMIAVVAVILGVLLRFPVWKWGTLLLTIALVLTAEMMNSALESLVDLVQPQKHPLAGQAKDIAAGAVLIASIISVIIGVLLYGPPLYQLMFE